MLAPPRRQGHQAHPPASQPRRHEDTKTITKPDRPPIQTQRRKDAKAQSPPTPPLAQRRSPDPRELSGVARFPAVGRPETGGPRSRLESELSSRHRGPTACALGERRPRHCSSFDDCERRPPTTHGRKGERQNRRAPGTASGEQRGGDERSGSEPARCLPAAGDPIACRSAAIKRESAHPCTSASASLRLCVFAFIGLGGRASCFPSCLRAFVVATWAGEWICVHLCDPWATPGGREIRNPKSEIRNPKSKPG